MEKEPKVMFTQTFDVGRGPRTFSYGPVIVMNVEEHKFKPQYDRVELRQQVYSNLTGRANNSNIEGIHEPEEFGFNPNLFEHGKPRVVWMSIPRHRLTNDKGEELTDDKSLAKAFEESKKSVEELLKKFPEACIYRILSDNIEDVLSEEQLAAANMPEFDIKMEDFANKCLTVRQSSNGVYYALTAKGEWRDDIAEIDQSTGKVIQVLKPEEAQYRSVGFSRTAQEDINLRKVVGRQQPDPATVSAEDIKTEEVKQETPEPEITKAE